MGKTMYPQIARVEGYKKKIVNFSIGTVTIILSGDSSYGKKSGCNSAKPKPFLIGLD